MRPLLLTLLLTSIPLLAETYQTNYGATISGTPIKIVGKTLVIQTSIAREHYPMSNFSEEEARRIAADLGQTDYIPRDILRKVNTHKNKIHHIYSLLRENKISNSQADILLSQERSALTTYLSTLLLSSQITQTEYILLSSL